MRAGNIVLIWMIYNSLDYIQMMITVRLTIQIRFFAFLKAWDSFIWSISKGKDVSLFLYSFLTRGVSDFLSSHPFGNVCKTVHTYCVVKNNVYIIRFHVYFTYLWRISKSKNSWVSLCTYSSHCVVLKKSHGKNPSQEF